MSTEIISNVWQRASAWSIVPHLFKVLLEWAGLIIGGTVLSFGKQDYQPYLLAVVLLVLPLLAVLRWRFTLFRRTEQGIELQQGWWSKHLLLLAQQRVQELEISQPPYLRPLQLYSLALDSAGSQQKEFALTGLSQAQLQALLGRPLTLVSTPSSTPFWRIWLATWYSLYLWLPMVAALGTLQSVLGNKIFGSLWQQLKQAFSDWQHSDHPLFWALLLLLAAVLGLALLLTALTFILLYPQHVQLEGGRWQLQHGTVLKKSQQIKAPLLQMVQISQPLLARGFGHYLLRLSGFSSQQQQSRFVLLGQTRAQVTQLLGQCWSQFADLLNAWQQPHWQRFAGQYFGRLQLYWWLSLLPVSALFIWLASTGWTAFGWLSIPLAFGSVIWWLWRGLDLALFRRYHGYQLTADVLLYWRAGFGQQWQLLPLWQVQQVRLVQSRLLQRHQLVKVQLATANGSVTLAAIPAAQAQAIYQRVLRLTRSVV